MSIRVRRSGEKSSGIEHGLENLPPSFEEYDICLSFFLFLFYFHFCFPFTFSPSALTRVSLFFVMHFSLLSFSLSLILCSCLPPPLSLLVKAAFYSLVLIRLALR